MKIKHLLLAFTALAVCFAAEAQETTAEKVKSFADKHLKLSGYLQGGFQWEESADPQSTFYLRRARVSLSGDAAKEKIDYRLQVDMAGSPKICDLYIRYKPFNALNLQLGQFKLPFSLENELYGPTKFVFIDYSYGTTYFTHNDGLYDGVKSSTGRDMGLQLYGGFIKRDGYSIINYNLGVFNGTGINTKDNNSSKDVIARLIIKPFKGFSVSGSYMYSESVKGDNEYFKSPRWSAGIIYDVRHWIVRTEYVAADFGGNNAQAFYALAGYHFEKPWTIAARYEFINDELKTLDQERVTLGAVYKPFKFLRLQLNMTYTMQHNAPVTEAQSSLGANLMVSAIF